MTVVLAVLGLMGAGVVTVTVIGMRNGWFSDQKATNQIVTPAFRGTLDIKVIERGSLESAANVQLTSKVEGSTAIIKIVEEGIRVKKGELLVELDSSKLRTDNTQQQIVVKQAEAAEMAAVEALAIQRTQNESDIAAAQLKLDLAVLDLTKYQEGEFKQLKNTIEGEIALASEEVTRAKESYEFTKRIASKGYATPAAVEADRIAEKKAVINHEAALEKLKVLVEFESVRQLKEKEANAKEFVRELERVRRKGEAALTQCEADLASRKLTASVEKSKLERLNQQIEACKLFAPQEGLVVYANQQSGRGGGSQEPMIQEGAMVRERQAIINLPDISRMRVNARIHESKIDLIEEGLPARIRVDAQPGKVFSGKVDTVSLVPLSGNWPNMNLKEYSTTVAILEAEVNGSSLKPGLTAEVEILVDTISNALLIPIQCIVERGGRHFVFVAKGPVVTRREVKIGRTNDSHVEVKDGLTAGELAVQNPRAALSSMMIELESEVPAEAPKEPLAVPAGSGTSDKPASGDVAADTKTKDRAEKRKKTGGGPGAGGAPDPASFMKRIDTDGDGKMSESEAPAFMKDRFATMDANGDKFVDLDEWTKASAAFRAAGGGGGGRGEGRGPGAEDSPRGEGRRGGGGATGAE